MPRGKVDWVMCLMVGLIVITLIGVLVPPIFGGRGGRGDHAYAIRDAKQWGYALFNFEGDYGAYPNEETAELLKQKFPDQAHLIKTETSNDYLRQLVIAGYIPEGDLTQSLDSDEFLLSYVVGLNSSMHSGHPLLIAPLAKGEHRFDEKRAKKLFNKRSVVLRIDMSVSDPRIDSDFLDFNQEYWGGKRPRIAWPK